MEPPDFSIVQESLSATLAKVALMRAQLSNVKNVLASKEREFELLRQEHQEAGHDATIQSAMAIVKRSATADIEEISAAIKNLTKTMPCLGAGGPPDDDAELPKPPPLETP